MFGNFVDDFVPAKILFKIFLVRFREDELIYEGSVHSKVVISRQKVTPDAWEFIPATIEYRAHDGLFEDGKAQWFVDRIDVEFENGEK